MRIALFICMITLLCGCKGNESAPASEKTASTKSNCTPIDQIEGSYPSEMNGVQIQEQKIEGDCLILQVSYHGCKDMGFKLLWNKMVKKSLPAQTSFFLQKIEKGGHCHEDNQRELRFDLTSLRSKTYGGRIFLSINNDEGILYEYPI